MLPTLAGQSDERVLPFRDRMAPKSRESATMRLQRTAAFGLRLRVGTR
jgi:hypothetical protein